jgi:hypothetical protein
MVESVLSHRRANPTHTRIHNWSLDPNKVADEIDSYLAVACQSMGWNQFIMEGSADPPRQQPSGPTATPFRGLKAAAVGSETIVDWLKSGADAVPQSQANARAAVCAQCSYNGRGDWTTIFTRPAAEAIKAAVEQRKGWKLSTEFDEELGTCTVCNCPLVLKQHMPLKDIVSKMKTEVYDALPIHCWMKKEAVK